MEPMKWRPGVGIVSCMRSAATQRPLPMRPYELSARGGGKSLDQPEDAHRRGRGDATQRTAPGVRWWCYSQQKEERAVLERKKQFRLVAVSVCSWTGVWIRRSGSM